ncbi:hypothetical protein XENORESO_011031 [Xenotaenia resolanae]|uniref:Uncharacterized protein n=1 Tax=Xenotaenia resolanae TaxID=208358 RepID=A0ABV0WJQ8_9TELE
MHRGVMFLSHYLQECLHVWQLKHHSFPTQTHRRHIRSHKLNVNTMLSRYSTGYITHTPEQQHGKSNKRSPSKHQTATGPSPHSVNLLVCLVWMCFLYFLYNFPDEELEDDAPAWIRLLT